MRKFEFASLLDVVEFRGALDIDCGSKGVTPRRLPAWTRTQIPEEMDTVVRMPAAVRIVFGTDATEIELVALATSFVPPFTDRLPVCFELDHGEGPISVGHMRGNAVFVNGRDPSKFERVDGEVEVWRFSLPPGQKQCQLWLPHNATVELRELRINDGARLMPPAENTMPLWAHYGSSISHCLEAVRATETWPAVAAKAANIAVQNLAFAGQCHLDPFIARTIRDLPTDFISIKVGINIVNRDSLRLRAFTPALHGFIDTIREKQRDTPITLISPIYCPAIETHPGPTTRDPNGNLIAIPGHEDVRDGSLSLERIRHLIAGTVARRNDPNLFYVDGLKLLGEPDLADLPDRLHPNPEGYRRMGQRYAEHHLLELVANRLQVV